MERVKLLNNNSIKTIAIICMLIDHLYKARLIPEIILFEALGRIAFPLFGFCIVEGIYHTRNKLNYWALIVVFAFLSEMPYDLMQYGKFSFMGNNVLWTFAIAISFICIAEYISSHDTLKGEFWLIFMAVLGGVLASVFRTDYMGVGVTYVMWLYAIKKREETPLIQILSIISALIAFNGSFVLIGAEKTQLFGMFSIVPILMYNGERGKKNIVIKTLFYSFYPIHMILIYAAKIMFF